MDHEDRRTLIVFLLQGGDEILIYSSDRYSLVPDVVTG